MLDENIIMTQAQATDCINANGGAPLQFRTVEALSLASLLTKTGIVDFLHSDIQGGERTVFPAQMEARNTSVRMCCISTHAKSIETVLLEASHDNDWILQAGHSCLSVGEGVDERVLKDGVVIWINPRLMA